MRWLYSSATYTTPESVVIPTGLLKEAIVPWPLAKDALPLPARVVTLHTQGGSALSPTPAQFAGVMQDIALEPPPGQKYPAPHEAQVVAEVAPNWLLYVPAAQLEGRQAVAPAVAEKVPAGQLKHRVAPLVLL